MRGRHSSLQTWKCCLMGFLREQVTTSMTTNAPASMIFAITLATAETRRGFEKVGGTLQNDIPRNTSPRRNGFTRRGPMRLITDTIEFCTREVPRFNPISISGYHIREAGSTALQELAFTLR